MRPALQLVAILSAAWLLACTQRIGQTDTAQPHHASAPSNAAAHSTAPSSAAPPSSSQTNGAQTNAAQATPAPHAPCQAPARSALDAAILDRSIELGTRFLLSNQRAEGNFIYAYDWSRSAIVAGDNAIRQAGATWALALLHQHQPSPDKLAAARRALKFFRDHSHLTDSGERYIRYPDSRHGSLGTVALVTLAHIDLLRAGVRDTTLEQQLPQYLAFLVKAQRRSGRFHAAYRHADGKPFGLPSPYYDGEALLALVKAARYLGRDDLRERALREADAGHAANVVRARAEEPDSPITKGYYQWASMAYYELATWPQTRAQKRHGDRLLEMADWMIDVHHTLRRRRNTAYAYEGLVPAYAIARERGEEARALRLRCVIDQGITKLTTWQVGGPLPNPHITATAAQDPHALGGVQNHRSEPLLRIDVTQHQMHALLMVRALVLQP